MKRSPMLLFLFFFAAACTGLPAGDYFDVSPLDIRGLLYVSEAHWAGSVDDTGSRDNPNDDFIELRSWYKGDLDVGGWTVVVQGESYLLIQLPQGTVIHSRDYFTLGNNTNGAFVYFDLVVPEMNLPAGDFTISIYDGGGQKQADQAVFGGGTSVPAGYNLPLVRKSAVRLTDYFGPVDALEPWVTYNATAPNEYVRDGYRNSVFASPGTSLGESGESANEE